MVSGGVVMGVVIWGRVKPVRLMGSMVSVGVMGGGDLRQGEPPTPIELMVSSG
ncbi:hypothetical protein RN09_2156 [Mycobacterium tuberculosis variant africanum]|nr:hypothetical protein RN09_2156 [Mycobacterium tuberculosis variant africanum]